MGSPEWGRLAKAGLHGAFSRDFSAMGQGDLLAGGGAFAPLPARVSAAGPVWPVLAVIKYRKDRSQPFPKRAHIGT